MKRYSVRDGGGLEQSGEDVEERRRRTDESAETRKAGQKQTL